MIWEPKFLTGLTELAVLGAALAVLVVFHRHRRVLRNLRLNGPISWIVFGLSLIALLYSSDLQALFAILGAPISVATRMAITDFHGQWSWLASLIAVASITFGLTGLLGRLLPQIGESLSRLNVELVARRQVESMLRETRRELEQRVEDRTAKLSEGERRFSEAQRIASLGNWEWDFASGDLHMSDEAFRIYGFEPQAFAATLDTCVQAIHPEDRDRVTESINESVSSGMPFSNKFRILRPDGTVRRVQERGEVIVGDDDKAVHMSGTVYDITARTLAEDKMRDSETRLRELFDNSPIGLWEEDWSPIKDVIDAIRNQGIEDWRQYFADNGDQLEEIYDLGEETRINQAALDIYGVPDKQAAVDISYADEVTPDELPQFLEILLTFIEGRTSYVYESKERAYDGTEIVTRRRVTIPPPTATAGHACSIQSRTFPSARSSRKNCEWPRSRPNWPTAPSRNSSPT